ncbi:MAG TPA: BMP family protein, partial [Chthonomonadales bacterium]|nr:BMP family protein [Chthonomonadales bacterium]
SGPTSDNGWNAGAYRAVLAVRKSLGLTPEQSPDIENATTPGEQEENLRAFAQKGFNVVFGHGAEYEEPALRIEHDFPNTLFVISSGSKVGEHTMPIVYRLEDAAYLLGMAAGAVTKTGKIASVGGEQIPPVISVFNAFALGAKAINPSVKVLPPVYTGSWDDVGKAKEATLALLDQGADVICQDVDAASKGVFNAVEEHKGAYALGTNNNQNDIAPDVVLASAPIYTDKVFVEIAKAAKAGTLKPNDRPYGMKDGIVDFVWNPQLKSKVSPAAITRIDAARAAILSGKLTVPVSR